MLKTTGLAISISLISTLSAFGQDRDAEALREQNFLLYERALEEAEACQGTCLFEKVEIEIWGAAHDAVRVNLPDRVAYLISSGAGAGRAGYTCYPQNYVEVDPDVDCYQVW